VAKCKEKAKEEDLRDELMIKVYTNGSGYEGQIDGSGYEGQIEAAAVLYHNGILKSKRKMRLGSIKKHTVYEGEGVGMILGLELLREERRVEGMVSIQIDNTAAIITMHAIKPGPSHYIWNLFH
jgi:hypothetical protein